MAKHRRFKSFTIDEVSTVDRPAQEGARIAILKRDNSSSAQEETKMADDLKVALDALQKKYADLQKNFEGLEVKNTSLTEENEFLSKIAALTADERKYCDTLISHTEKSAFVNKSRTQRATEIDDAEKANPVIFKSESGIEFRKNDDPRYVNMARENDEVKKQLKESAALIADQRYEKRATSELGNVTGDTKHKVMILKAVDGIEGDDDKKEIVKILTAVNNIAKMTFTRIGTTTVTKDGNTSDYSSADQEIANLAAEYQKSNPNVTKEVAEARVLDTPAGQQLYKRYEDERRAALRSAN